MIKFTIILHELLVSPIKWFRLNVFIIKARFPSPKHHVNDWLLVRFKLYCSIALRKFQVLPWISHILCLTFLSLLFAIWVSFIIFYSSLYHGICKNTERDISTTYSPCRQKRNYGIWLPFCLIRGLWSTNSMGVVYVEITYKLLWGLWNSYSSFPHWDRAYLCLTSFIDRILPSSNLASLGLTFCSIMTPIIIWCD